jgi:hypothetical protein
MDKPKIRHNKWFDVGSIVVEVPGNKFYKYVLTSRYFYDQALKRKRGWYRDLKTNADSVNKVKPRKK